MPLKEILLEIFRVIEYTYVKAMVTVPLNYGLKLLIGR